MNWLETQWLDPLAHRNSSCGHKRVSTGCCVPQSIQRSDQHLKAACNSRVSRACLLDKPILHFRDALRASGATMRQLLFAVVAAALLLSQQATAQRLFFAKYLQRTFAAGGCAVEIFNPSCQSIDLSEFDVRIAVNGASFGGIPAVSLTGTLASHQSILICHDTATISANPACTLRRAAMSVTGADAVGLFHNGILVDTIGAAGEYTSGSWSVAGTAAATVNHLLVRKPTVREGTIQVSNLVLPITCVPVSA